MPRNREDWQRSLDTTSRIAFGESHCEPGDIESGIKEYRSRFRGDIKELADEFSGSYQKEFQRSVEQIRNRFKRYRENKKQDLFKGAK